MDSPSLFVSLIKQVREWIGGPRPAPLWMSSIPAGVFNFGQDFRLDPASWVNSLLVHILAITALIVPYAAERAIKSVGVPKSPGLQKTLLFLPVLSGPDKENHGGGGGGDRSRTPASKGAIPEFANEQLAPPSVSRLETPQLPVQPTLLGPSQLKLPEMAMKMDWGDPTGVVGPKSGGLGTRSGMGPGDGTGIGPGEGPGVGPGKNGGYGDEIYQVGGKVKAPVPIFKPEPPYSEQARKAKYQGTVDLSIVVDTQGNVADIRVVKFLGMGLDESALETVRKWKFQPGRRNGVPVPVRVMIEVTFRLF